MAAIVSNANSVLQAILSGHCQITMRYESSSSLMKHPSQKRPTFQFASRKYRNAAKITLRFRSLVYKYSQFFSGGDLRTEIFVSGTEVFVFRDAKLTESPYE